MRAFESGKPMVSQSEIFAASILIVDDREANVSLFEHMLRAAGYRSIASTTDPHEVCELQRRNRYHVILLDLHMPEMDGFRVMEQLKEIERDDYLPVLVITAEPEYKLRALQAGARDFIPKPFDPAELLMRVRNLAEVRLLHMEAKNYARVLEETVREVEASRELIRHQKDELRSLYEQVVTEQKLAERLQLNALPDSIAIRPDDEIRPLVPAFLASRSRDVETLRAALTALDFETIRALGYGLKETGRGYGFNGITELGGAIERAAHHQDTEAVHTRIDQLGQYLQRVQVVE